METTFVTEEVERTRSESCNIDDSHYGTYPTIEWCLQNGYKIPKWLAKCNISCPFVKGKVFMGKYGPINYTEYGDPDGQLVLTFHGFNGNHSTFLAFQEVLSNNGYRVLAFDLYGHGLSGYPRYKVFGRTFSTSFYAEQATELLTHTNLLDRKVSVIGISMGCCIAAEFCKMYPTRVEHLILISPAGLIPKKPFGVKLLNHFHCCIPCAQCCVSKCCFSRSYKKLSEKSGRADSNANRLFWTLFVTKRAPSNLLGIVNRLPLWNCHQLYTNVGSLKIPTLILFGSDDTLTPPKCADKLSQMFQNSHVIIFPKADHLLPFKKPVNVISSCLAFLAIPKGHSVGRFLHLMPFDAIGQYVPKKERLERISMFERAEVTSSSGCDAKGSEYKSNLIVVKQFEPEE